ncbi:MAG: hypothetical protein V3S93_00515 [Methyloceanibacter sp.]
MTPRPVTPIRRALVGRVLGALSAAAWAAAFFAARIASGAKRLAMEDTLGSGSGATDTRLGTRFGAGSISAAILWAKSCGLGNSGI